MKKKVLMTLAMVGFLSAGATQLFANVNFGLHPCCPVTSSQGGSNFAYEASSGLVHCYYIMPDYSTYIEANTCF